VCFLPNFSTSYIETTLFIILYADDTVILSESESDLQAQHDAFHEYCLTWNLKVNIDKNKIVIFGSGRTPQTLSFACRKFLCHLRIRKIKTG
jgi:hypothetical protein